MVGLCVCVFLAWHPWQLSHVSPAPFSQMWSNTWDDQWATRSPSYSLISFSILLFWRLWENISRKVLFFICFGKSEPMGFGNLERTPSFYIYFFHRPNLASVIKHAWAYQDVEPRLQPKCLRVCSCICSPGKSMTKSNLIANTKQHDELGKVHRHLPNEHNILAYYMLCFFPPLGIIYRPVTLG